MRVLAAGLNAHHQISPQDGDVYNFTLLHEHADEVLLATWSNIVVTRNAHITITGHQRTTIKEAIPGCRSAIGDHNGLIAVLDDTNNIHVVELTPPGSIASFSSLNHTSEAHPAQYTHLALAGNGRLAAISQQDSQHDVSTEILEWKSFEDFRASHGESDSEGCQPRSLLAPGKARQLVAGTGIFAMLNEDGEVYTWGDPRHLTLARSIVGEDTKPADQPGLVDALAGVKLNKVCLGGWMGGAISEDGAAYIWGAGQPGDPTLKDLADLKASGEKSALVQLASADGGEPDVVDMAIGSGHVALITSDGEVFVAGENGDGQLGLDITDAHVDAWRKVPNVRNAARVERGPRCTIILADT